MVRPTLAPLLFLAAACAGGTTTSSTGGAVAPSAAAPADGEAVLRLMHDRYAGKWYKTLTFRQQTTRTTPSGETRHETWYEASLLPGKLRIDIAPVDSGNAILFLGDSAITFRRGQRAAARQDRNLLMTLGFDVYGQPVDSSVAQLRAEGTDLSKVHDGVWQGRPVWIVGASEGDTTATQFWVEKDRLLFVRLIQQLPPNPNQPNAPAPLLDVVFDKYQPLAGGWIAPDVIIRVNGREVQREIYDEIHANVPLEPGLFDATAYRRPGWVK
ncbi:MAG TPA: hypothetical protein VFS40_01985 [Gemmatimonadales bacterium]|nr:hypothetical protein [Gemmatimonadales bacterium]